jgi:TetR/AcrR family transcriptional repressor of nem operon
LSSTRDRLVDVALQLIEAKGYHGASIAEILAAANANSGSLYHFFPTKQDLLVAVLGRYLEGIYPWLLDPLWAGVPDPVERIFALLDGYRRALIDSDFAYGCPIGNLALEFKEPDPEVREMIGANFLAWRRAIEVCLEQASDRFPADLNRADLAAFVLTTMEGGVMQARTHRSIDAFDAGVSQLRRYFQLLMSPLSKQENGDG